MNVIQAVVDAWFERQRDLQPRVYHPRTRDGWRLALYRYFPERAAHRTPVVLCHGMSSNRWNMDGPGRISLARYLVRRGYDVWVCELRGAGRSTRPSWINGKRYDWTFEDYVQHDAPAILRVVLRETGAADVHWVGHSMGGMIAYALLLTPVGQRLASVVTLGSPTMSEVRHPMLELGLPYRGLLRFVPDRLPVGTLARMGSPFAAVMSYLLNHGISDLGWHAGNADAELLRTLLLTAVDDIPASLLREFARWYDAKAMSDRYGIFNFTEQLERIAAPMLIIAGSHDGLTPPRDLENVFRRVGSHDKVYRVVGKEQGFSHDYGHADLILGVHAPTDVYPLILKWLDEHRVTRATTARKNNLRSLRKTSGSSDS